LGDRRVGNAQEKLGVRPERRKIKKKKDEAGESKIKYCGGKSAKNKKTD